MTEQQKNNPVKLVEVSDLYKVFGKNPQKIVKQRKEGKTKEEVLKKTKNTIGVDGVDFHINEGELFVLMGLSGSGKSTILRCLNRLIEPTQGSIKVGGVDITKLSDSQMRKFRQEHMGMVFQQFALLPNRTVLENAGFGLEIQGISKEEREKEAYEALELVGLKGWENKYPSQLSGGMKQRVGIARALVAKPNILLMDEAFSALDPLIREEMQDLLLEILGDTGKTVVFITHDLNEALKIGDRIGFLKDGQLIQVGTPEEIVNNPADEYVEKFVRGVDKTKILTAGDVMTKVHTYTKIADGPSAALHTMKSNGISSAFVLDKHREVKGIVTVEEAIQARKDGITALADMELSMPYTVSNDEPISDIMNLIAEAKIPVAVVNEKNRLMGILVRGNVLSGLAPDSNDNSGGDDLDK